MQTFFVLPTSYRKDLYDEIDFLIREGKGGYTFNDVYEMPTYLRKYLITKISTENQKIIQEMNAKKNVIDANTDLSKLVKKNKKSKADPYVTKAGKK